MPPPVDLVFKLPSDARACMDDHVHVVGVIVRAERVGSFGDGVFTLFLTDSSMASGSDLPVQLSDALARGIGADFRNQVVTLSHLFIPTSTLRSSSHSQLALLKPSTSEDPVFTALRDWAASVFVEDEDPIASLGTGDN